MSHRGTLLARDMRWRLGASLLTVVAAAIAVGAAVLGPLYLHTAGDSLLRRTVAAAPVQDSGLTLPIDSTQNDALPRVQRAVAAALTLGRGHRFYGAPLISVVGQSGADGPHHAPYGFAVIARTDVCRVLRFDAGRCDLGAGDTVVSARSARRLGVGLGGVVPLTVTGIYAIPNLSAPTGGAKDSRPSHSARRRPTCPRNLTRCSSLRRPRSRFAHRSPSTARPGGPTQSVPKCPSPPVTSTPATRRR